MQKRGFFRIDYPPQERPGLILSGRSHEVLDLSEGGVRYRHLGPDAPAVGDRVSAVLAFSETERLPVSGTVLRKSGGDVVLRLVPGVPFAKVISEQQRLLRKYKTLKRP
jgi:hypothetical protein